MEIVLRLMWQAPRWLGAARIPPLMVSPEPDTWEPRPGWSGPLHISANLPSSSVDAGAVVMDVRFNSHGLRGPELPPRSRGDVRVLFVGDSMVFGHGMDEDATFAAQAASALASSLRRPVLACNGGVPGYGFSDAVKRMGRLAERFEVDAFVVSLFIANDFIDGLRQAHSAVLDGRLFVGRSAVMMQTTWRGPLAFRSRLWFWIEDVLMKAAPSWSLAGVLEPDEEDRARTAGFPTPPLRRYHGLFLDSKDPERTWVPGEPPPLPRLLDELHVSLQLAQQIAGERPLLVLILPSRMQFEGAVRQTALRKQAFDPQRYRVGLIQKRILAVCKELEIPALDLTRVLINADDLDSLFQADMHHFTPEGNRMVGVALAGRLAILLR